MAREKRWFASTEPRTFLPDEAFDWPAIEAALERELSSEERAILRDITCDQHYWLTREKLVINQPSLDTLQSRHGNKVECDSCGNIHHKEGGIDLPLRASMTVPFNLSVREYALWQIMVRLELIGFDQLSSTSSNTVLSRGQLVLKYLIDIADPIGKNIADAKFRKGERSTDPYDIANAFRNELTTVRGKIPEQVRKNMGLQGLPRPNTKK